MTGERWRDRPTVDRPAVDALVRLLDLRQLDDGPVRGHEPAGRPQRVFGGQVAGQALVAAGRTVDPSRRVHSLHGYFVRAGDPTEPIEYEVENIRDGRSFSVRRCVATPARQDHLHRCRPRSSGEETGWTIRRPAPPDVPGAGRGADDGRAAGPLPGAAAAIWSLIPRPMDVRYVASRAGCARASGRPSAHQRVWMRIDGKLPDDPLLHACALTFASDLTLLDASCRCTARSGGRAAWSGPAWTTRCGSTGRSGPTNGSCTTAGARRLPARRGLATGRMFTQDGRNIATAVQEGLLRRVGG